MPIDRSLLVQHVSNQRQMRLFNGCLRPVWMDQVSVQRGLADALPSGALESGAQAGYHDAWSTISSV